MRNKYRGKCAVCGKAVEAGAGNLRNGKPWCEGCSTFSEEFAQAAADKVLMPGGVVVSDTDDGYDAWKDELVTRGTFGYRRGS